MEFMVGQILLLPFKFQMRDLLPCDGRILNINEHHVLFALIGSTYGGDGHSTFALPDLRSSVPNPNMQYYIATYGIFPERY
ncbi:MAG: tail fiber protein [Arcobacteraceae bacterium]|jgi:microcystin-dependent protein|nr:tail fiber protein [Arcobacteraceae bacterium]